MLGAARITSTTDQSVNARACAQCYDVLRERLLRAHPWNFAIQRFQLAPNATAPLFGPQTAYPLPTGWLRVLPPDVFYNSNDRDWIIEGGQILTNNFDSFQAPNLASSIVTPNLPVRIVMSITDTTLMDVSYREALAALMGSAMCEQLTQSNTKKADCKAAYKEAIEEAKKNNAIEKVPQQAAEDRWITQRA